MMKRIFLFFALVTISNFSFGKKLTNKDVKKLYKMMAGFYSSEKQSISDTDYFHIRLKMKPMWTEKKGEYWLYVEQAMNTSEDKPYRQRVYQLQLLNDSTITSTVYTIKNGEKYFGDYKKDKPLDGLSPADLEARKGCLIFLHKVGKKHFAGGTHANDCESSLRGASYATTEVDIQKGRVLSWDRGFDKEGKHVWGAEKGGYIFLSTK